MSAAFKLETTEQARALLAEVRRRTIARPQFVDVNFPKQAAFQNDPARFKAMLCTRRAGKSYGIGNWLLDPLYSTPNVTSIYAALTRDSAKKIMWRDVILHLNDKLKLGGKPNQTELSLTLPNGSVLYLTGLDASPDEMKKLLGQKPKRVAIDEAGEFKQDLNEIVYSMLRPSLVDHKGELTLLGTPGVLPQGLFYEVSSGQRKGWSVHKWSALDNPYVSKNFQDEINDLMAENPRIVETPWYRRMMLGEWVTETSKLVYKYEQGRNYVQELPDDTYSHVLGVDLGFDDASAFVVAAYSNSSPNLYFTKPYKQSGMIITDVVTRIRDYMHKFPISKIIVDGAAKQAVEEMRQRYQLPLEAAEKHGKAEFIEIMNSDFIQGKIKLVGEESAPLAEEYGGLIWDDDELPKRVEHSACQNHLTDAALYAWRYCYQYLFKERVKVIRTTEQKIDQWVEKESRKIANRSTASKPFWMK